jgi:predicted nucleic acid-binding protein
MIVMRFVDTNILLYALSTAADEQEKALKALAILESEDLALSSQVLQEFYVQATRPTKADHVTHEQATSLMEAYLRFPVQETTVPIIRAALAAKQRYVISYWDAAILEAARALSCTTLLTEDLDDGRNYDGVMVENPFRSL